MEVYFSEVIMQQTKIRKYEIVDITGNDHARISSRTGRNLRFVAILEDGPDGPRFSRRQFPKASQARTYKRFVLHRLAKLREVAAWFRPLASQARVIARHEGLEPGEHTFNLAGEKVADA